MKLLDGLARGDKGAADRPRRLKPGTVLVREYQGERHTVTVVPDGFLWRDSTYKSLTTIARAITGTAWSGPRFFGVAQMLVELSTIASSRLKTVCPSLPTFGVCCHGILCSPELRASQRRHNNTRSTDVFPGHDVMPD